MITSESPVAMNGPVLYILPASRDSSIISKGISKTRSLSDLAMVYKTPSENLLADRRNSVTGAFTMDTTLATASAVEGFVGPFKTLQEAQAAANLLKQKNYMSGLPATVNLPQNINGSPNVFQSKRSPANRNPIEVPTALNPPVFLNEPNKFTWTKPLSFLPTIKNGSHQVCPPANPDVCKTQNNLSSAPVTLSSEVSSADSAAKSILFSGKVCTAKARSSSKDSDASPEEWASEPEKPPAKKRSPKRKKENIPTITKVTTLVFFDLETTGLAFEIGKPNVQITEISMIAMNRKEFEESKHDDLRDIRIIQKLCLCTRPRSMVSSGAASVTGLNNQNLMDQNPFEHNAAEAINFFLSHLPKPVCLLAHNGNPYDFPLLKAEFSRLSMSLPPDILIADTLKAFRVLGVPVFPPEKKISGKVKFTKKGQVSYSLSNLHLYLFNKNPVGSHSSEGDCIALAKVCHRLKDLMLLWIDENCTTLEKISPMW